MGAKLIVQTVESVVSKLFVLWRMSRHTDLFAPTEQFKSLDLFCSALNREDPFRTFILDMSIELFW